MVPKASIPHTRGIKIECVIMCFWNTSKELSCSGFCAVECCLNIQSWYSRSQKSCSGFLFWVFVLFYWEGRWGFCLLGCLFVCSLYFICLEWLEGNLVDRVQQCTKCSAKQCKLLSTLIGIFSQWRLGFVFTISACVWLTYFFPASLCRIRLATHPVKASSVFCPKYVINPALHGLEIHRMSLDLRST